MHRAPRAATDKRDPHPRWYSFPRDVQQHRCWQHLPRLQLRPTGPNFHAEHALDHSPLLREFCLASYPPLTHMLKFSRFAGLASCQKREGAMPLAAAAASCVSPTKMLLVPHLLCAPGAHAHSGTHISAARPHNFDIAAKSDMPDTEASARSRMPQTPSAHSRPCLLYTSDAADE